MESLIRTNSNSRSSTFFHSSNPLNFPYLYGGYGKIPVNDINYIYVDPDNSSTDARSRFLLTLEHHMVGEIVLEWDQAALTIGTPGTYERFVDWVAYEMIDHIELRYLTKVVQNIPGIKLILLNSIVKEDKELERDALDAG